MPTVTIEADRSIFYETSGGGSQQLVFVHGFRNPGDPVHRSATGSTPADLRRGTSTFPGPAAASPRKRGLGARSTATRKRPPVLPGAETDRYGAGRAQPRRRNRTAGCAAASAGVQRPGARRAYSGCGHQQHVSHEQLESVISPTGDQLATFAGAAFHRQLDQQPSAASW